jgi:ABC-type polysaccharide/polyol phosphate export permease
MWMFLTNVLYPLPSDGSTALRLITTINPMVPIISAYRHVVIDGRLPEALPFATALAVAALFSASGWAAYRALEGRFAERV